MLSVAERRSVGCCTALIIFPRPSSIGATDGRFGFAADGKGKGKGETNTISVISGWARCERSNDKHRTGRKRQRDRARHLILIPLL